VSGTNIDEGGGRFVKLRAWDDRFESPPLAWCITSSTGHEKVSGRKKVNIMVPDTFSAPVTKSRTAESEFLADHTPRAVAGGTRSVPDTLTLKTQQL
jgi:hypothetical protein